MKLNVKTVLNGFDGKPIKTKDTDTGPERDLLVSDVLMACAAVGPVQGKTYTPAEQISRYQLGVDTFKASASEDDGIEISAEFASALKNDVCRLYAPVVAGQFIPLLDGK